jgi:hypothetical protein
VTLSVADDSGAVDSIRLVARNYSACVPSMVDCKQMDCSMNSVVVVVDCMDGYYSANYTLAVAGAAAVVADSDDVMKLVAKAVQE